MSYSVTSAAAAAGINKTTLLRAIKAGRISAQRDETGSWQIDAAELHRVFPLPTVATDHSAAAERDAITNALVSELCEIIVNLRAAATDYAAAAEREAKTDALLRATIVDLRADRDHWRAAFEDAQRRLPPPTPHTSEPLPHATKPLPKRGNATGSPKSDPFYVVRDLVRIVTMKCWRWLEVRLGQAKAVGQNAPPESDWSEVPRFVRGKLDQSEAPKFVLDGNAASASKLSAGSQ